MSTRVILACFFLVALVTGLRDAAIGSSAAASPFEQSIPPAANSSPVVAFDGATFSPATVTVAAGASIELQNATDQDYTLSVRARTLEPMLFLPMVVKENTGLATQGQSAAAASDLDFPAHSAVYVTIDSAGAWAIALGELENVQLNVEVQAPATPTPAPTPTPLPPPVEQREWTLHKSADGAHPDGNEQQLLWLLNRARANPAAEGAWLATTDLPDIAGGRNYFQVDTAKLQQEFASYGARPPAAFDVRLFNAALAHSLDLIARDAQDHNGQFQRVAEAGFECAGGRGNVFAFADSSLNAHGAFNIDWGTDPDGMQPGRGHRMAIMSLDGDYTNVGLAMAPESNPGTSVGPLVTTGNYCHAVSFAADHHNRFLVGTVWSDNDGDGLYDPGEGIGGISVRPDHGDYYAVTAASGGFAIPITTPGTYLVQFDIEGGAERSVVVGEESVLVDLALPAGSGLNRPPTRPAPADRYATPVAPGPALRFPGSAPQP
ncbi:MAG: hypothetical protein H3C34_14520 [Caldilineaceae bacterium]|nr:hypothetical protein [Caldilineaceae bacterium]